MFAPNFSCKNRLGFQLVTNNYMEIMIIFCPTGQISVSSGPGYLKKEKLHIVTQMSALLYNL